MSPTVLAKYSCYWLCQQFILFSQVSYLSTMTDSFFYFNLQYRSPVETKLIVFKVMKVFNLIYFLSNSIRDSQLNFLPCFPPSVSLLYLLYFSSWLMNQEVVSVLQDDLICSNHYFCMSLHSISYFFMIKVETLPFLKYFFLVLLWIL